MCSDIFVVGLGYTGRRLAKLWQSEGAKVSALVRDPSRLEGTGIVAVSGDLDRPDTFAPLGLSGAVVYYFAPPPEQGPDDPRVQGFLTAIDEGRRPAKIVYVSTTGVYGDCQGEWIDESRPLNPENDRSWRRVAAERAMGDWCAKNRVSLVILRVAGIYGPGRLPIERIEKGAAVLREEESPFTNRIHVDDLASVCMAAGEKGEGVFNVADGHPSTMADYYNRVADAAGLPRPPQIDWAEAQQTLSPGMLSFLTESKRIDNRKLREDLGVELRYADLDVGIRASI